MAHQVEDHLFMNHFRFEEKVIQCKSCIAIYGHIQFHILREHLLSEHTDRENAHLNAYSITSRKTYKCSIKDCSFEIEVDINVLIALKDHLKYKHPGVLDPQYIEAFEKETSIYLENLTDSDDYED